MNWQQNDLPADLREWTGRDLLIKLVLTAVQPVDDSRLRRADAAYDADALPPRTMLTLLVYAYAVGILGSTEMERHLAADDALNYLSIGKQPSADCIRRFRNQNREAIAGCLARVGCAVRRIRMAVQGVDPVQASRQAGLTANWFASLMELQCLCEARQRLARAEEQDRPVWMVAE